MPECPTLNHYFTLGDVYIMMWNNDSFRGYILKTPIYQTSHCDFIGAKHTLTLNMCSQWAWHPNIRVLGR